MFQLPVEIDFVKQKNYFLLICQFHRLLPVYVQEVPSSCIYVNKVLCKYHFYFDFEGKPLFLPDDHQVLHEH